MYLSRVVINNYRSIKSLDLSFAKGKNVIVGRNNSGKSNIVKAIDLLLGEYQPDYQKSENISESDFFMKDDSENGGKIQESEIFIFCQLTKDEGESLNWNEIENCRGYARRVDDKMWRSGRNTWTDFTIELSEFGETERGLIFEHDYEDNPGVFDKSKQTLWVDNGIKNQVKFKTELEGVCQFAFAFQAVLDEGIIQKKFRMLYRSSEDEEWHVCFHSPIRNALIQSAIMPSFRDPQNQLRINNWTWYGKLLKASIDTSNKKLQAAFEEVKKISAEVFAGLQTKVGDSKVKIAFPDTKISFQFNPDTKHDVHKGALIYVDDGCNSLLQDKGSGIQSAIIIGLFHFYVTEVAHLSGSLLAIEEPELYLHPHARRVLSSRLDDFVEGGANQVIITTHSAEFVATADKNLNIIVVSKNTETGTCAQNARFDTSNDRRLLVKKQNAEMFFSDLTILVEGADKYLLEVTAEEYGAIRKLPEGKGWLDAANISVISANGKNEFWKYAGKLGELGIAWVVLADFDFFSNGLI